MNQHHGINLYMAGAEHFNFTRVLHAAGYPFRLCSYYYLNELSPPKLESMLETTHDGSDWIMDSGLLSLMFGAEKEKAASWKYDDFNLFAVDYIARMQAIGWKHRIVECDTQRILGMDATMRLREEVFDQCGFEVIYVWHIPETLPGLLELAQTRKHIALSVPELRGVRERKELPQQGTVKQMLMRLTREIRASGNDPTVHLLGNTDGALLTVDADSGDSTSWKAGPRWGLGHVYNRSEKMLDQLSLYSPKWAAWKAYCMRTYPEEFARLRKVFPDEQRYGYFSGAMCSMYSFWLMMEAFHGKEIKRVAGW